RGVTFPPMSTLTEIEAAVEKLAHAEQAELLRFISTRLHEAKNRGRKPRGELLAKWRGRTSGAVGQCGGTQAYLNAIRGRNEDGHCYIGAARFALARSDGCGAERKTAIPAARRTGCRTSRLRR